MLVLNRVRFLVCIVYLFQIQTVNDIREIMLISNFSTKTDGDSESPINKEELSIAQQLALKGSEGHDNNEDTSLETNQPPVDSEEEIEDTDSIHAESTVSSSSGDHNISVMKADPSDDGGSGHKELKMDNNNVNNVSNSSETIDMTVMESDILPPQRSKDLAMVLISDD